ncbi:MAG: FG-GAP-like repeat-containing protein [Beutenbergiaceae bacterium]
MRVFRVAAALAAAALIPGLSITAAAAVYATPTEPAASANVPQTATDDGGADPEETEPEVEVLDLEDPDVVVDDPSAAPSEESTDPVTPSPDPDSDDSSADPDATGDPATSDGGDAADGWARAIFSSQTPGLAIVGVSWQIGTGPEDLQLSFRSRSEAGWSQWEEIHVEITEAPDDGELPPDARDGSSPVVVIDATEVEIQVESQSGTLPEDVLVGVVDPGAAAADVSDVDDAQLDTGGQSGDGPTDSGAPESSAPESSETAGTSGPEPQGISGVPGLGSATAGSAAMAAPAPVDIAAAVAPMASARPVIYSRAQWGADESQMTWTPRQGTVQGIDIHHTVNANNYTSAQVPGIIRGIYLYHAQSWGRGWGDIGYNFLVDRFGRVWQGRAGGIENAPIGAHASGLNSYMSGISLIGNFEQVAVPSVMFTAVAQLAAWKLTHHGIHTAYGTLSLPSGTFSRIVGHRDAKNTSCPGRYMYNRLGEMRALIASYMADSAGQPLDRDLTGNGRSDLVVNNNGAISLLATTNRGFWTTRTIGTGWSRTRTLNAGDFNGNGYQDLILVDANGRMLLYPGTASGGVNDGSRTRIGHGWGIANLILGGTDWDNDGNADILARMHNGDLSLYRGNGSGRFVGAQRIGVGWQMMSEMTVVPDFVGGRDAILGKVAATGALRIYLADGHGGFASAPSSQSWSGFRQTVGIGDATSDGVGDVLAVDTAGRLWLYPGSGGGGLAASERVRFGTGWANLRIVDRGAIGSESLAIGAIGTDGRILRYAYESQSAFSSVFDTGARTAANARVFPIGDWDGDRRPDLAAIAPNGDLLLFQGLGNGRFATSGTKIGNSWGSFTAVVGAGSWTGYGSGIVALHAATGNLWLYPGDGSGGFRPRVLLSSAVGGMDRLLNAGLWDGDSRPDLVVRSSGSSALMLLAGNAAGTVSAPTQIGRGWGAMSAIVGANDVTGDGHADLVAVTAAGQVLLYRGDGNGGFLSSATVGQIPAGWAVS